MYLKLKQFLFESNSDYFGESSHLQEVLQVNNLQKLTYQTIQTRFIRI